MKKPQHIVKLFFAVAALSLASCHNNDTANTTTADTTESLIEKYQLELLYSNNDTDWEHVGGFSVTKYRTPDGFIIEDSTSYAPNNSSVRVTDPQGRLYAVGGKCSESIYYTCVKYLYGQDNEVSGLLAIPYYYNNVDDHFGVEALDSIIKYDWWYSIDVFYFLAFESDSNALYFSRYLFRRDSAGRINKVYDPIYCQSIVAPYGHHILYEVKKSENFWRSDIEGGSYDVIFRTEPDNPDEEQPIRKTYYGYLERR